MLDIILFGVIAYFLGSFNAALWLAKWFKGVDIREFGSKNAGATNCLRVVGWKLALPAFILDATKSFIAVSLANYQNIFYAGSENFIQLQICLGMIAVLGHIFPIYSGFKGGKGVASLLGMVIGINPIAALLALLVFIIVFTTTRIVSISSMIAGISFPFIVVYIIHASQHSLVIFAIVAAVLLLISHKKNIKRLLNREEKQISFRS